MFVSENIKYFETQIIIEYRNFRELKSWDPHYDITGFLRMAIHT